MKKAVFYILECTTLFQDTEIDTEELMCTTNATRALNSFTEFIASLMSEYEYEASEENDESLQTWRFFNYQGYKGCTLQVNFWKK
jgi:hypothetical protein